MKRLGISIAILMLLATVGGLLTLPTGAAVQGENDGAVGIVITADKLSPGSDGWLQLTDGSKQWINSTCRNKLESQGVDVKVMAWSKLAKMRDQPYRSCGQLSVGQPAASTTTALSVPGGSDGAVGIVITADKLTSGSDGWLRLTDGSKQWINSSCRNKLESQGVTVGVMAWSTIAKMRDQPYRSCDKLPVGQPAASTTTALSVPQVTTTVSPTTSPAEPGVTTTAVPDPNVTTTEPSTTSTDAPASTTTTTVKPSNPKKPTIGSGVNFSSGEYWCVSGYDVFEHEIPDAKIARQMADLGIETVRLPLNEHCWLGGNAFGYIKPHLRGESYRSRVVEFVDVLNGHGMTVVLDLHWNAPAGQQARGQKNMADADHALDFWSSVASRFRTNPNVVFDVYNEPHSISWQCWRDGCSSDGWQVAGMQDLVDTVRRTGATQPIILNGLDWGGDLRGWLDHVPNDPQNNLIAGFHAYNKIHDSSNVWHKRCSTESCWSSELRSIVDAGYGVVIGEAGQDVGAKGCGTDFLQRLFRWADQNGIPYLGWSYNPHGCSSPALLTSYDGSLTPAGQVLASHLKR